ncbi:hypothetical protein EDB92DRAFT_1945879 [Lactarius akahatsu]|uniref:Uncharacterized protein n=1 Tax=Lactarius akahatsu TaxID=416441 RepID=A0AAD4QDL1_9AGAM|nr:hypothetical protein EDB92DRAFT_1945879 [Lactarius akahatsu]
MSLKISQSSAKHREASLPQSPPNDLDNAVLQTPRLFGHRHCIGQHRYRLCHPRTLGSLDPVTKILGGLLGLNLDALVAAGCVLNVLWYFLDFRIQLVG